MMSLKVILYRTAPEGFPGFWQTMEGEIPKITMDDGLMEGTHRVNIHVGFRGKIFMDRADGKFTYKKLQTKIKAICQHAGMQPEYIQTIKITKD